MLLRPLVQSMYPKYPQIQRFFGLAQWAIMGAFLSSLPKTWVDLAMAAWWLPTIPIEQKG
jgi:hypothetical protein